MATKDRRIVSDPQIMMGKPTIAGTRITVETIIGKLAAGEKRRNDSRSTPALDVGRHSSGSGVCR